MRAGEAPAGARWPGPALIPRWASEVEYTNVKGRLLTLSWRYSCMLNVVTVCVMGRVRGSCFFVL